ncbi:MAG: hypothetical protein ABI165_00635 [Bryobacteraceae bacterium]
MINFKTSVEKGSRYSWMAVAVAACMFAGSGSILANGTNNQTPISGLAAVAPQSPANGQTAISPFPPPDPDSGFGNFAS